MKKVALILLLAGVAFASCSGQTRKNNEQNKEEKKMKTIHLTKSEFLTKVVDYEKNPNEWKYLGDKPAIIEIVLVLAAVLVADRLVERLVGARRRA